VLSHAGSLPEVRDPAVVGCGDATARIAEGTKVRVDARPAKSNFFEHNLNRTVTREETA